MSHPPHHASTGVTLAFRLGLFFQMTLGLAQFGSGLALSLSPKGAILRLIEWLTRNEVVQDPQDRLVQLIQNWARHLSPSGQGFYSYYLLGHGLLNVFVALALLKHVPGSYVVSLIVMTGFMAAQIWEYSHTFDPMLIVLTAIDVVVIGVITLERHQRLES